MKFLVDENLGRHVVQYLFKQGYSAIHITEIQVGFEDDQILNISDLENRVLITFDKDFGKIVFQEGKSHKGVILLRLEDQTPVNTIKALKKVIKRSDQIEGYFIVVEEKDGKFRVRRRANKSPN